MCQQIPPVGFKRVTTVYNSERIAVIRFPNNFNFIETYRVSLTF
jgi:hypothetical protein